MPRRLTSALVAVASVAACSGAHPRPAVAPTSTTIPAPGCTLPPTVPVGNLSPSTAPPRVAAICDVVFGRGDALGVELHPTARAVAVQASNAGFEVCPPTAAFRFGTYREFSRCIPIQVRAPIDLPSTGTALAHVGWIVRPVARDSAQLGWLRITYEAVDRHVLIVPSAAAASAMTVAFTPETKSDIGASTYIDGLPSNATVECRQGGRALPWAAVDATVAGIEGGFACRDATVGAPVLARVRTSPAVTRGLQLLLECK